MGLNTITESCDEVLSHCTYPLLVYLCIWLLTQSGAKEEEPISFTVKLVKYADDSKIKLIKEVKSLVEGMNLVQV